MDFVKKSEGPCVILAGAGTGKTYSIIQKIKHIIKNNIYESDRIVCLTFSNEAANNLFSRIQKEVHIGVGKEPIIKTFHSFSADLLRKYAHKNSSKPNFKIIEPDEMKIVLHRHFKINSYNCSKYVSSIGIAKDLGITRDDLRNYLKSNLKGRDESRIREIMEELQFEFQTMHLKKTDKDKKEELGNDISRLGNLLELKKFISSWEGYEKLKAARNYKDYSDLNNEALELLRKHPDISSDFDYIIVDEFQDTNKIQLDMIFELAKKGNVCVVGDLNQSIYRFRGAYKDNFQLFKKHFNLKNEDVFNLTKSYRSSNKILRNAHRLIENNYADKSECFSVENFSGREGDEIRSFEMLNGKEEARKIADLIKDELEKGTKEENICVMYRNHHYSKALKQALDFYGISYCSVSKGSLLKQKSVSLVRDYVAVAEHLSKSKSGIESYLWNLFYNSDFNAKDLAVLGKIIKFNKEELQTLLFTPNSSINVSDNARKILEIITKRVNDLKAIIGLESSELIKEAYRICGLIREDETKEYRNVMANLNKFYDLAKTHSEIYENDIGHFLEYLELVETLSIDIQAAEIEEKGIRLMTLHSTKGLEYDVVILSNLAQKRFPIEKHANRTVIPIELYPEFRNMDMNEEELSSYIKQYEEKNQLSEERRLCYVSFTRARNRLYLTYANEYGARKFYPSQFLSEIEYKSNPDIVFLQDKNVDYSKKEEQIIQTGANSFVSAQDIVIESEKPKITFSPSALLAYNECQKKYEYKYVFNMPERKEVSWDAINLGSFVHEILDLGVKNNFKSISEFINLAREARLNEEWEGVEIDDAIHLIKIFFERNKDKYNDKSKTEIELTTEINGHRFKGYADRIDFHEDGIEIVDYKTGSTQVAALHRNWQLGYYAIAAKNNGLGRVKRVTLDMLKQDKPIEFDVNDKGEAHSAHGNVRFNIYEIEQELVETASNITISYEKGFKACPIDKNCEFCSEYVYKKF